MFSARRKSKLTVLVVIYCAFDSLVVARAKPSKSLSDMMECERRFPKAYMGFVPHTSALSSSTKARPWLKCEHSFQKTTNFSTLLVLNRIYAQHHKEMLILLFGLLKAPSEYLKNNPGHCRFHFRWKPTTKLSQILWMLWKSFQFLLKFVIYIF